MMGIALYLVWMRGWGKKKVKKAVSVFLIHLVVNSLWSIVFFGLNEIEVALVVILILWLMIAWLIKLFGEIDRRVAYLLIPYFMWVSFAAVLNYSIWRLN
jgi:tryptophan-rich sensory protein